MRKFSIPTSNAFVLLLLLTVMSCTGQKGHPIKNAVANGGFEASGKDITGWVLEADHSEREIGSAPGEPVPTITNDAHDGKNSVHVFWDIPDSDSWGSLWTLTNSTLYPVKPGEEFTVTAWMKGKTGFRCGKVWLNVIGLKDGKVMKVGIGRDMLNARSYWMKFEAKTIVPEDCNQIQVKFTGGFRTDLFIDEVQVLEGLPAPHQKALKPLVAGFAAERIAEKLNRGVVAMPVANREVYIGWRLLDTDDNSVAFNIYRASGNNPPVLLNEKPLTQTTDFIDKNPVKKGTSGYFVRSILNGAEEASSEIANVTLPAVKDSCIVIKLNGNYSANKAAVGDLDGDGQYEYVIKTPNKSFDPWAGDGTPGRGFWRPSPETYKLEAFRLDGTMMWRYDMGWSIEMGGWFSPYVVYDLNGDGCSEVALKAGEGDPRDPDGHVTSGPEYLMILDGRTGNEITRTDWIPREGYDSHESLNRNQLCVAYLDGKTPCIIAERGTYDVIALAAYCLENGKLRELWKWNDREEEGLTYTAQGAHNIHGTDVDGDGRDEVAIGSAVVDDNGVGLWTNSGWLSPVRGGGSTYGYNGGSGRGHPDKMVIGEMDPNRPGLEMYLCIEPGMEKNAACQVDAATGELNWGVDTVSAHMGMGLIADIDPTPGVELWTGDEEYKGFWLFSAQGKVLSRKGFNGTAFYWDGDLQREILNREKKSLYNYATGMEYGTKFPSGALVIADVLGDWREEVILSVPGELRIYTTTIPAADRRTCLMRDPIYRLDVCEASSGYFSLPAFKKNPGF